MSKSNVLAKIADTTRKRIQVQQMVKSLEQLKAEWQNQSRTHQPKSFAAAFRHPWNVIAEVKKASPSQGDIAIDVDPVEVARAYIQNGAAALSVLTEPSYFKGSVEYLQHIRRAFPEAYILQKDFVVDSYQLYEAACIGADCILLIVAMLGADETRRLHGIARQLGLSALVEVHDREELEIAKDIGAKLIGVNNRNLKTMAISLDTSRDLIAHVPADAVPVAESGLKDHLDLVELKALGYQAFLVGTQLMQGGDPGRALKELIAP